MELKVLKNIQVELEFMELEFQKIKEKKNSKFNFAITKLSKNRVLHKFQNRGISLNSFR